jgi:hypothetical protein
MDFRTEWSSWVLVVLMMIISYVVYPWATTGNIGMLILQIIGLPIAAIAISSIPVLIVCYLIKVIPDIDYSIRVAFLYFIYLLIMHLIQ